VGQYVFYLIKHLAAVEDNEYVLFENHFRPICTDGKFPPHGANVTHRSLRWPTGVLERLWKRFSFPKIESFVGQLDVFHEPMLHVVPPARAATVVTLYDFVALRYPEYYPEWYVEGFTRSLGMVARRADRVIAISDSTKADVLRFTEIPEERICVTPLAADPVFAPIEDRDAVARHLSRFDIQSGYILYIGGADPHKNLDMLLDAYSRLPDELQEQHALVFAGAPSEGYERLHARAASMGIGPRLNYLGYVADEDLPWLYNGAAVAAFPSVFEGFGLVPLEAMSCGTPVIASETSSLSEVVADAGITIDPKSVEELTTALTEVLGDSTRHAALVQQGLTRANNFSWDKTAQATLAAYTEAVDSRS